MFAPVPQADGCQPGPADLEAAVLGAQREVAGRADDRAVLASTVTKRQLGSGSAVERRVVEVRATRRASRLRDAQPAPGARVARRLPEPVVVLAARAARAARCAPSSVGCRPSLHVTRQLHCGPCRSTSTPAWSASRTSRSSSGTASRRRRAPTAAPRRCRSSSRSSRRTAPRRSRASAADGGGGGGCCGGSCGCGH